MPLVISRRVVGSGTVDSKAAVPHRPGLSPLPALAVEERTHGDVAEAGGRVARLGPLADRPRVDQRAVDSYVARPAG
jgi:hypothetical protein